MDLKETIENYKKTISNKKPGEIIMSFSSNCISSGDCLCWRCLVNRGAEPNEFTEKQAEVISLISRFKLDSSTICIAKTDEEKKLTINYAISNLKIRVNLLEQL